jgi:Carboxylesterase family
MCIIDDDPLPYLKLPYATYQALEYDKTHDIYLFANIRFAAPPLGKYRWAAPQPPLKETVVQNGSFGRICPQYPGELAGLPLVIPTESSLMIEIQCSTG